MKTKLIITIAAIATLVISVLNFMQSENDKIQPNEPQHPEITDIVMIADSLEYFELEKMIRLNPESFRKNANGEYIIPVAVHIIHDGDALNTGSNISDEQIYSAINGMNEAYSKELLTDEDGDGAESPFRFALQNKDDIGNPTTGIYRVDGSLLSSTYASEGITAGQGQGESETTVKNWSRQDNQHTYNIWVVSEIENNNAGGGIQGYAYFPTTSIVDGTVVVYNAFGKTGNLKSYTNKNKTITHELGHGLALFHTFQGGSCDESNCNIQGDRVCDTDPHPQTSSCTLSICGGNFNKNNYMGYTSQTCKNEFTQGQIDRMSATYENSRDEFITSTALDNMQDLVTEFTFELIEPDEIVCANSTEYITVNIQNTGDEVIHKIDFEYTINGIPTVYNWWGPIGSGDDDDITIASVDVETEDIEITVSVLSVNDQLVSVSDSVSLTVPSNEAYSVNYLADVLGGQISWNIREDSATGPIVYQITDYPNFQTGTLFTSPVCLLDGCYVFTVTDLLPPLTTDDAYIRLIDNEGTILVDATTSFGEIQYEFCVGDTTSTELELVDYSFNCLNFNGDLEISFSTINDASVDYYNVYKREPNQDDVWNWFASIEPNGTIDQINEYIFTDDNYTESPTLYGVKAFFFDGSSEILGKAPIYCSVPIVSVSCDWSISNGKITSSEYKTSEIYIYDFAGNSVVNKNLQPGYYVLSLGRDGKCRSKIHIGN